MDKLDLNACGVSEMTTEEMKKVDGGIAPWLAILIVAAAIAVIYLLGGGEGETNLEVTADADTDINVGAEAA